MHGALEINSLTTLLPQLSEIGFLFLPSDGGAERCLVHAKEYGSWCEDVLWPKLGQLKELLSLRPMSASPRPSLFWTQRRQANKIVPLTFSWSSSFRSCAQFHMFVLCPISYKNHPSKRWFATSHLNTHTHTFSVSHLLTSLLIRFCCSPDLAGIVHCIPHGTPHGPNMRRWMKVKA